MLTEWLGETSIVGMVLGGSLIAKLVLLILALMSALSWAIIIIKALQYHNIRKEDQKFYQIYLNESSLNQIKKVSSEYLFSAFSFIFSATYQEAARMSQRIQRSSPDISESNSMLPYLSQQLQRVIEKAINERYSFIENRLNILATISSAAPFIGLFGTVLGIINSFQSIGTTGVTSLASVAPGISEALVATAAGLLAAIPALMAYNYFRNQARLLTNTMRNFGMEITNRFEWIVNGRLLGRE
ncbi:MAG: MotA/TolQ/ExbB proton channel family protein [SAR324 cluster bacterium]|jgi:biopolymer transport protein TolQ|nr:MotA/TolQ/ExbB proton channel family protein [SAR324 cluster bacterium]MEC9220748.1 MotA/TolQ/ExbB proton channel family protein [SAR324 cluster bacterium]